MLILILLILFIILIICLYQLFKLIKWTIKKKIRIKLALGFIGVIALVILVNHLFFKNMKFIQSKVYPDVYLVKHPIENKDSLHTIIKKKILQIVSHQLKISSKKIKLPYRLHFYEYYTGTPFFIPFGEAGTTHFIEHKEDPGGFSSEELSHYNRYCIANFDLKFCENDSINYVGIINYHQNLEMIKKDTIIHQCKPPEIKKQGELVSETY